MLKKFLLALAASVLLPLAAVAAPITYLYSGVATGLLGGAAFQQVHFEISAQADTANIGNWCCSPLQNTHASASITLAGIGTFSFSGATHTWTGGDQLGFGNNLLENYLTLQLPDFVGYGLDTALGPVVDASATTDGQFVDVVTSGGLLTLRTLDSAVTFQAIPATAVPEPGALSLLGAALAALALARRRNAG